MQSIKENEIEWWYHVKCKHLNLVMQTERQSVLIKVLNAVNTHIKSRVGKASTELCHVPLS